jgi:hypothetical protein
MNANKTGRNDPCHCGSGQKYKKCCATKDELARSQELTAQAVARAAEAAAKAAEAEKEAEAAAATGSKGAPQASAAVKTPRPKLPRPHHGNLPRRGSV